VINIFFFGEHIHRHTQTNLRIVCFFYRTADTQRNFASCMIVWNRMQATQRFENTKHRAPHRKQSDRGHTRILTRDLLICSQPLWPLSYVPDACQSVYVKGIGPRPNELGRAQSKRKGAKYSLPSAQHQTAG
jgi:hypothetical protein